MEFSTKKMRRELNDLTQRINNAEVYLMSVSIGQWEEEQRALNDQVAAMIRYSDLLKKRIAFYIAHPDLKEVDDERN